MTRYTNVSAGTNLQSKAQAGTHTSARARAHWTHARCRVCARGFRFIFPRYIFRIQFVSRSELHAASCASISRCKSSDAPPAMRACIMHLLREKYPGGVESAMQKRERRAHAAADFPSNRNARKVTTDRRCARVSRDAHYAPRSPVVRTRRAILP